MSQTGALARARALREALLDHGVAAVSIELVVGRPGGPNGAWFDERWVGTMGHHIVSHRGMGLTPGLSLVKVGRSDLPGPLCNGYGGFDEIARIICMGWANHAGAGGPYTVPSGTVPENGGRPYWFGWEFEGGIRLSDWTESFRTFMGRCHAATLEWRGLDERSHIEHTTWAPGRKVDRLNYTLGAARAEVAANRKDDMDEPTLRRILRDEFRIDHEAEDHEGNQYSQSGVVQDSVGRLSYGSGSRREFIGSVLVSGRNFARQAARQTTPTRLREAAKYAIGAAGGVGVANAEDIVAQMGRLLSGG